MKDMNKHTKLRIESWCKKFCQITSNIVWKKNRNLHAICLLDMILNNRFEEPYNKFPNDGPLPLLSKPIIKSKLSKKFWLYSQYLESQNCLNNEDDCSSSENNNKNSFAFENNNYIFNENKMNFKKNYNRPKSSGIKLNNNISKNRINNKKIKTNDIDEINKLNEIIYNLQYELNKQDFIINNQINEKMKLQKRISELEQIIKNFC